MAEKLHATKFALAGGIITAICIFFSTIVAVISPGYGAAYIGILESIYGFLGYKATFFGAVLGAVYSFVDGFILTWIFALIYNKLL